MKKTTTQKQLVRYSALATAILASVQSEAQISYTDIDPDKVMDLSQGATQLNYFLDLDNDGADDVLIQNWYASSRGTYWGDIYVLRDPQSNAVLGELASSFYQQPIASVLNSGDPISSMEEWQEAVVMLMYYDHRWLNQSNKYFGVKFNKADGVHYGWVRLSVSGTGNVIYVKDYAYELQPNSPTTAGDETPCGDGFEPNNSFSTAKEITTNLGYHALIPIPLDKDYFEYNLTLPNIRITLNELPADYDLKLFDDAHLLVAQSSKQGLKKETIIANGISSGNYFIKVYAANGSFDSTECYNLKVEASNLPFKGEDQNTEDNEISALNLFPNPAHDQLEIKLSHSVPADLVLLYDMEGRRVKELSFANSDQAINLNISDLQSGIYMVLIRTGSELLTKKFVKE